MISGQKRNRSLSSTAPPPAFSMPPPAVDHEEAGVLPGLESLLEIQKVLLEIQSLRRSHHHHLTMTNIAMRGKGRWGVHLLVIS
jgi:hypothetical protein